MEKPSLRFDSLEEGRHCWAEQHENTWKTTEDSFLVKKKPPQAVPEDRKTLEKTGGRSSRRQTTSSSWGTLQWRSAEASPSPGPVKSRPLSSQLKVFTSTTRHICYFSQRWRVKKKEKQKKTRDYATSFQLHLWTQTETQRTKSASGFSKGAWPSLTWNHWVEP